MNDLATLCILYEDFRFETRRLTDSLKTLETGMDQEAFYWIRRSLLTMHEFGGRLNSICNREEFRIAATSMSQSRRDILTNARRFINKSPLRDARNKFGGHLDPKVIGFGLKFHGPSAIAKIENVDSTDELSLRLEFARDLFRGAFASNFAADTQELAEKLNVFYGNLAATHWQILNATYVLVLEFVWDRFGRGM